MSRYRLPPRVGPSPASEEPGLQNAAARLRSSREAQSRLLGGRRAIVSTEAEQKGADHGSDDPAPAPGLTCETLSQASAVHLAAPANMVEALSQLGNVKVSRKEKVVVVFRLAVTAERRVAGIPGAGEVGVAYAMRSLVKEGRAALRKLSAADDLAPLTDLAKMAKTLGPNERTVGEPMTVYVQPAMLDAMHHAIGDPWKVEPRATVVGAYLTAIVTRLIETRQAG